MDRSRLTELHYIAHIDNVASILSRGLLSHNRAQAVDHVSVAMEEVQDIRAGKVIPQGRPLHDYVNLYVHARNAMLSKVRHLNHDLTVLRVDPAVVDLPGVIVADRNAAGPAAFLPAAEGIAALDEEAVFATWWTSSLDARQRRCAEVLVPDVVDPAQVVGAYVCTDACAERLRGTAGAGLAVQVKDDLFFHGGTAP